MVISKQERKVVVAYVAIQTDGGIRKKKHGKLNTYRRLKKELKRMLGLKASVVPLVIGALGNVTPKLGECLQIPGKTSGISLQKSVVLGTVKIQGTCIPKAPA